MSYTTHKLNMPQKVQEYLSSNKMFFDFLMSCYSFNLPQETIQKISPIVGQAMVKMVDINKILEVAKMNCPEKMSHGVAVSILERVFTPFADIFPEITSHIHNWKKYSQAPTITEEVARQNIFREYPWMREALQPKKEDGDEAKRVFKIASQVTILQIMSKYPKAMDTRITERDITLKGNPRPVAPSIKNWISAYHQALGAGTHESMERNAYLYQNPNTHTLSAEERSRLVELFKGLDENSTLAFNPETQQIIFTQATPQKSSQVTRQPFNRTQKPQPQDEPKDIFEMRREDEQKAFLTKLTSSEQTALPDSSNGFPITSQTSQTPSIQRMRGGVPNFATITQDTNPYPTTAQVPTRSKMSKREEDYEPHITPESSSVPYSQHKMNNGLHDFGNMALGWSQEPPIESNQASREQFSRPYGNGLNQFTANTEALQQSPAQKTAPDERLTASLFKRMAANDQQQHNPMRHQEAEQKITRFPLSKPKENGVPSANNHSNTLHSPNSIRFTSPQHLPGEN